MPIATCRRAASPTSSLGPFAPDHVPRTTTTRTHNHTHMGTRKGTHAVNDGIVGTAAPHYVVQTSTSLANCSVTPCWHYMKLRGCRSYVATWLHSAMLARYHLTPLPTPAGSQRTLHCGRWPAVHSAEEQHRQHPRQQKQGKGQPTRNLLPIISQHAALHAARC